MQTKSETGNRIGILGVLATKAAKLFKAVKLLKVTQFLLTSSSMALSIVVYSFSMGIMFATGFVAVLFIHEMGHVAAMRIKGYPTKAPVFIPFFGAAVFVPGFHTPEDEAFIGYGGPFAGMLISALLYGLWLAHPEHPIGMLRLSYISTFINLFNLIPIRPLDGGRITQIVGSWFRYVSLACFLGYVVYAGEPDLLFLVVLFLTEMKIDGQVRFAAGLLVQIALLFFWITGHSKESLFGFIFTMLLLSVINWMLWVKRGTNNVEEEEFVVAPSETRFRWFMAYATLGAILIALMHVQLPLLPPVKP